MKMVFAISFLCIAFVACNQNGSQTANNSSFAGADTAKISTGGAAEDSKPNTFFKPDSLVERILFDADLDGRVDTVSLFRPSAWEDPGDFHFISLRLASNHRFDLSYTGGWYSLDHESDSVSFPALRKLSVAQSRNIFALRIDSAPITLLLFGVQYASSPGQLTALKVLLDTVKVVFREEIMISSVTDVDGDGVPDLVGNHYVEGWRADSVQYETYDPYEIVSLGSFQSIADPIIRRYNDEHYFGNPPEGTTGPCVVVRLKGQKPFIMGEEEAYSKYGR